MERLATLEELADQPALPSREEIEALGQSPDPGARVVAGLFRATLLWREGHEEKALADLLDAGRDLGCLPLPLIVNVAWLCRRNGWHAVAARECLGFARHAFADRYWDLGLEAASAAMILDAMGDLSLTGDPAVCAEVAGAYEQAAKTMPRPVGGSHPDGPLRVGLLVPNLVDGVVAYTQRVLQFVRFADRSRFDIRVYVSENHAARTAPMFPVGCIEHTSETRGEKTLRELRERDVPVTLGRRDLRARDAAGDLAARMAADGLDALIVQSGLSAPIDWLAARVASVPVKLSIHIGSSLLASGFDAVFFDNPANLEREAEVWPPDGGERIVLEKGTDIDALTRGPPLERSALGIPDDAIAIGCLSNHLEQRLSIKFMSVIARILARHERAWFVPFGADEIPDKMAFFRERGVANRVRFGGRREDKGAALRMLDIYANEFPVGGSQSAIEAMACGLPVAALRWSSRHAESAAAAIVGEPDAIPSADPVAYESLLEKWIVNPAERLAVAERSRRRAQAHFSAERYVRRILDRAASTGPTA